MCLLGFVRIVSSCTAKQEHRGIGYEVNRSEKRTNSLGNFTEIPEPIVAQRYTVAYPVYRLPALPQKSRVIVGGGQYRNAVASGDVEPLNFAMNYVCSKPTRRYRVTVLTSSKSES